MSSVISREIIEELRRQKAGQARPKLRREGVRFTPTNSDEIARLVGALVMAMGQSSTHRTGAA